MSAEFETEDQNGETLLVTVDPECQSVCEEILLRVDRLLELEEVP